MDRLKALKFFEEAPESALFDQKLIAVVRDCSTFTLERDRTRGGGIPFIKINRSVLSATENPMWCNGLINMSRA